MTTIDRNYEASIVDYITMSNMPTCQQRKKKYQPEPLMFQKKWLWPYSDRMARVRWARQFRPSSPCDGCDGCGGCNTQSMVFWWFLVMLLVFLFKWF